MLKKNKKENVNIDNKEINDIDNKETNKNDTPFKNAEIKIKYEYTYY